MAFGDEDISITIFARIPIQRDKQTRPHVREKKKRRAFHQQVAGSTFVAAIKCTHTNWGKIIVKTAVRKTSMTKSAATTKPQWQIAYETELGWMCLVASSRGVITLKFRYPTLTALRAASTSSEWSNIVILGKPAQVKRDLAGAPPWLPELVKALRDYAAGKEVDFTKFPLDLAAKTPFQQRVINACRAIPRGQTMTYGKLAVKAKAPGAARAVGSVMARNGLPLLIPCHRVVGSNGLHGFSAPGGLATKQLLLDLERERASMK